MEGGCQAFAWINALKQTDQNRFKQICHILREDGAYVDVGENDNLIVQKLLSDPMALGILGFSFLDQNADRLQASKIDRVLPTFQSIAEGKYPVSRPLYIYVKKAHVGVVPGIEEYLAEFTSENAWGEAGYLADKGMIPLAAEQRAAVAARLKKLDTLASP